MNEKENIFQECFDCPECGNHTARVVYVSAPSPINGSYVVTWECQNLDCEHIYSAGY